MSDPRSSLTRYDFGNFYELLQVRLQNCHDLALACRTAADRAPLLAASAALAQEFLEEFQAWPPPLPETAPARAQPIWLEVHRTTRLLDHELRFLAAARQPATIATRSQAIAQHLERLLGYWGAIAQALGEALADP